MKKLLFLAFIALTIGCGPQTNFESQNYKYEVIDTVYVSRNGFNDILDYTVIIKDGDTYFSARQETNGNISAIYRKLNHLEKIINRNDTLKNKSYENN